MRSQNGSPGHTPTRTAPATVSLPPKNLCRADDATKHGPMEYEIVADALKQRSGGVATATLVEELRRSVRYIDPRAECMDPECGRHAAFVEGAAVAKEPRHRVPEPPAVTDITADDLRTNGAKYKIGELKELLKERGLPVSGTKPVLLERLIAYLEEQ